MTLEDENIDLFKSEVVGRKVVDEVVLTVYANGIYHVRIPRFKKVTVDIVKMGQDFVEEMGNHTYYNIFEFSSFSDVDPEVREWAADKDGSRYAHSDAIVIDSLPQKIIADFYLRFHKPETPTKFFYSLEKAIDWTFEQMKKDTEK